MNEEINAGMEPEKPKGHIRGIWAITIIVVVAMLVGGGVWWWYYSTTVQDTGNLNTSTTTPSPSPTASGSASASPTSNETTNWQTYANQTYDFSIKYPRDWAYRDFTKNLEGVMFYEKSKNITTTTWDNLVLIPGDIGLHFNKIENNLNDNLAKFASESPNCKIEDKKIAGKDGKLLNCPIEEAGKGTTGIRKWYLVENNNVVFELFTSNDAKKDTLDKMISTLKFL